MSKTKENVWDKVVRYSPDIDIQQTLEGEDWYNPYMQEDKHGEYVALEDYEKLVDIIKAYQEMLYGLPKVK